MCTTASPANIQLFVDILDKYVYYFENGNSYINHNFISGLYALIMEHMSSIGNSNLISDAREHFSQIVSYIEVKKSDPVLGEKFLPIVCS